LLATTIVVRRQIPIETGLLAVAWLNAKSVLVRLFCGTIQVQRYPSGDAPMGVTQADIESFQRFAVERLAACGAESMTELLRAWETAEQRRETIESVKRGIADLEAGRTRPANEVLDELRGRINSR
jgi:hypothetical protein